MAESAAEAGKQEIVFLIIGHVEWRFLRIENGIEVVDSALTCSNGGAGCKRDDNGDSGDVGFE